MTYTANDPRSLIDTILARLTAETGLLVGDAEKPDGVVTTDEELPVAPYLVVYPDDDEATDGTLDNPDSDVWWIFEVESVGGRRDQAQVGQAKTRSALLGWRPAPTGLAAGLVELETGSGVGRDDDVNPPLFSTGDRFRVFTSPT